MAHKLVKSRSLLTAPIEAALHRAWDALPSEARQVTQPLPWVGTPAAEGLSIPRHPTLDQLITSGRMNPRQHQGFAAAANVRIDGVRLGEIPPTMRTPSRNEFRYDKRTCETRILAHALTAAGFDDLNIHMRERPDAEIRISDGTLIHAEIAELHEPLSAEWSNNVARIHVEAIDALDADAKQQEKLLGSMFEFRVRTLPTSAQARRIALEIGSFIREEAFAHIPERTLSTIDASYPMMASHLRFYRAPLRRTRGHLAVHPDAHTFDPRGLFQIAEKVITRKRLLAPQYQVRPHWLILGTTDNRGNFSATLDAIAAAPPVITPFERVLIHYEGNVLILGHHGLIARRAA